MISDTGMYDSDQTAPDPSTEPTSQNIFLTPESVINNVQNIMNSSAASFVGQNLSERFGFFQEKFSQNESKIRPYFAVDQKSVIQKIKGLACPFIIKNWSRSVPEGHPAIPLVNPNLPEFYTPLLCAFTYLLFSSLVQGSQEKFSYDWFSRTFFKIFTIIAFEVVITYFLFYIFSIPNTIGIFTLLADYGCINFYLALSTMFCWNTTLRIIVLLYSAVAAFTWYIKNLNPKTSAQPSRASSAATYTILFIALFQAILLFVLVDKIRAPPVVAKAAAQAATHATKVVQEDVQ